MSIHRFANDVRSRIARADLRHAEFMKAAEHVPNEKVVASIPIDIRKVDAHREVTGGANGQIGQSAEVALPIVNPDSIRGLKIVADVKVRVAVAVDVTEHRREA